MRHHGLRSLPRRPRADDGGVRRDRPVPARLGLAVTFVRNVTDVDDKIIRKADAERRTAAEVAHEYTAKMNEDLRALDVAAADHEPSATEHIAEVIEIIERLESKRPGLRRRAATSTTRSRGSPPYGQLSGQSIDDLRAGARIEVGEQQAQPARLRAVEGGQARRAVVGRARGARAARAGTSSARRWRIATSASPSTSTAAARTSIFPHHENEIAQSRGRLRRRAVRAPLDAHRLRELRRREDVEVARQRLHHPQGRRDPRSARRCACA